MTTLNPETQLDQSEDYCSKRLNNCCFAITPTIELNEPMINNTLQTRMQAFYRAINCSCLGLN